MSYYGYDRSSQYLSHKGKKGAKWGYTNGKRNGKRTANGKEESGESYLDLLKRVPPNTKTQYTYKGKTYMLSDYKEYAGGEGRAIYKNGNHTIAVVKGKGLKDKKYTTSGNGKVHTHVEEGKLKRAKEDFNKKAAKVDRNIKKSTKKASNVAKKTVKSVAKQAEKGKKTVEKWLKKNKTSKKKSKKTITVKSSLK